MTVDYEEGRRLVKEWDEIGTVDAYDDLFKWFYANKDALLNPDPWRPIEELPEEWKDGRKLDLWVRDYADGGFRIPGCKWGIPWPGAAPCWLELKPHPDALHDWEWQPIDFVPTHFRELKGPGQ